MEQNSISRRFLSRCSAEQLLKEQNDRESGFLDVLIFGQSFLECLFGKGETVETYTFSREFTTALNRPFVFFFEQVKCQALIILMMMILQKIHKLLQIYMYLHDNYYRSEQILSIFDGEYYLEELDFTVCITKTHA